MTLIAIDPGKGGGVALLHKPEPAPLNTSQHVEALAMPSTLGDFASMLAEEQRNEPNVTAYVEHVQGFAGKNRPGFHMFALGESFGAIKGMLAARQIRTVLVRPQKWQKIYALGTRSACKSDSEWKNKLKAEAQRRFPHLTVTLKTADALLLLDYALRQERNQTT